MLFNEFAERAASLDVKALAEKARKARGDILTMTTLSASGHPGGSMSTIDMLMTVYALADINPSNVASAKRDRIIVSHGHVSPAVYSCLSAYGFIPREDAVSRFRKAGSIYEGHIERYVNGVEWTTGNLGQGLSVACGIAVSGRVKKDEFDIYVFMGDGEQQKGQIAEARRFAKKYAFNNITVIIDYNKLQISGDVKRVMPSMDLAASFKADGWLVLEINGHDYKDIAGALMKAKSAGQPTVILADTVMGKGVSFMENKEAYHGSTLSEEQYNAAMKELGLEPEYAHFKQLREKFKPSGACHTIDKVVPKVAEGTPVTYAADVKTDNRSAFGKALEDIADLNIAAGVPLAVFDCDLAGSVKTSGILKKYPENFFQCGIAEHHTAVCAGAASSDGALSFFAAFGMFGVDEVYNQQRLNEINETNLKLVTTHVGIDVGEDGKTHMCIDYIGLVRNIFGFGIITPADPNETDRTVRHAAAHYGNTLIAMGRSKTPVITDEQGAPIFAGDYKFEYGKPTVVRKGTYPILAYGSTLHRALKVREILEKNGISAAVVNVSTPSYIADKFDNVFCNAEKVFVYEDHNPYTGLFATIATKAVMNGYKCKVTPLGVDRFPCSGATDDVFKVLGLDHESVAQKIMNEVMKK